MARSTKTFEVSRHLRSMYGTHSDLAKLLRERYIGNLDVQLQNMVLAWKEYQEILPKHDRITLDSNPPTLRNIELACDQWYKAYRAKEDDKLISIKENFQQFCNTLDAHSDLFSVFPNGDKYVSLLSGTISSIVKASVNHGKINEGFAIALRTIAGLMRHWQAQLELHGRYASTPHGSFGRSLTSPKIRTPFTNEIVVSIIAELYTHVFKFLTNMMKKWIRSSFRRATRSFDKTFRSEYIDKPMAALERLSQELDREAIDLHQRETREEFSYLKTKLEDRPENRRHAFEAQGYYDDPSQIPNLKQLGNQKFVLLVGYSANELALSNLASLTRPQGPQYAARIRHGSAVDDGGFSGKDDSILGGGVIPIENREPSESRDGQRASLISQTNARSFLEHASRSLEPYRQHDFPMLDERRKLEIPKQSFQGVQDWLTGTGSEALWIYGPGEAHRPSTMVLAAAYIVKTLEEVPLPFVAYNCDLENARFSLLAEFSNLVFCLLRQLVLLVKSDLDTIDRTYEHRFEELGDGEEGISEAISLIEEILPMAPRLLYCVLGNLDSLEATAREALYLHGSDHSSIEGNQADFVLNCISRIFTILLRSKEHKNLKILFATDGFSSFFNTEEIVDKKIKALVSTRSGSAKHANKDLRHLSYSSDEFSGSQEDA
ncbi:hypothetical protein EV356DRAFT_501695 [Viridothelium virens]|uniref:Uncharacterized protein n=1 Tax=Viridothelium virens TaxID=1048519 RepID=A0A6A6HAB1_VIRVR|nr:hypothetical protein EV356DRAFT_501695 [Viridothelium virens]